MNYVLVFRPEVQEELNETYSWYKCDLINVAVS